MFSGKVAIEIDSKEPRDHFLAHVKYLEILSANLTRNGQNIELKEAMEYEPNEFFVFWTRNTEPKGKYIMNFGMLWNISVTTKIAKSADLLFSDNIFPLYNGL